MKKFLFLSFLCLVLTFLTNTAIAQCNTNTPHPGDPVKCCVWLEQIEESHPNQIITLYGEPADYGKLHLNPQVLGENIVLNGGKPQGKAEYYYFRFVNCSGNPNLKVSIDWEFYLNGACYNNPLDATFANPANRLNVEFEWSLPLLTGVNPLGEPNFLGSGPLRSGKGLNAETLYTFINGVKHAVRTDFPGQIDGGAEGALYGYFKSYYQNRWYNYFYADFLQWLCENNYIRIKITRYSTEPVAAQFKVMERIGGTDFQEYYMSDAQHIYMGGHGAILGPVINHFWLVPPVYVEGESQTLCAYDSDFGYGPYNHLIIPANDTIITVPIPHYNEEWLCDPYVDSVELQKWTFRAVPGAPIMDSVAICGIGAATLTGYHEYDSDEYAYTFTYNWYSDPELTDLMWTGKTYTADYDEVGIYEVFVTAVEGEDHPCESEPTRYVVRVHPALVAEMENMSACPMQEWYYLTEDLVVVSNGYDEGFSFEWTGTAEEGGNAVELVDNACGNEYPVGVTVTDLYSGCTATAEANIIIEEVEPDFQIEEIVYVIMDDAIFENGEVINQLCDNVDHAMIPGGPYDIDIQCMEYYDGELVTYDLSPTDSEFEKYEQCIESAAGFFTRTWTLTTYCGSVASKDQTIVLQDIYPPHSATIEADETVEISAVFGPECTIIIPEGTTASLKELFGIYDNCTTYEDIDVHLILGTTVIGDGDIVDLEGIYQVEAIDECGNSSIFDITIHIPTFTVGITANDDNVCSTNDIEIELTATPFGGYGEHTYVWCGEGSGISNINCPEDGEGMELPVITIHPVAELQHVTTALTYTVTVTDENGCVATNHIVILLKPIPQFFATVTPEYTCNSNVKGKITLSPPIYQYYFPDINHPIEPMPSGLIVIPDLIAGDYTVIAEDLNPLNGCMSEQVITVGEVPVGFNESLLLGNTPTPLQHHDLGVCLEDGAATIYLDMAYDKKPGFTYSTHYVVEPNEGIEIVQEGSPAIAIVYIPGFYEIKGYVRNETTDCESTDSEDNVLNVYALELELTTDKPFICENGSTGASVTITPSEEEILELGYSITYSWWPEGETTPYITVNADNAVFNVTVTLTYGNGEIALAQCQKEGSVIVLTDVDAPEWSYDIVGENCAGEEALGSITINATGGNPYIGEDGTPYYLYTFDGGETWVTENYFESIGGIYWIGIKDANDCEMSAVVTIPDPINANYEEALCYGDFVTVYVSGGVAPYHLEGGEPFDSEIDIEFVESNYNIQIIDDAGCIFDLTLTGPEQLIGSYEEALCHGEFVTITLSATGGTGEYTFWYEGEPIEGGVIDLYAGIYEIVVTDERGCEATIEVIIEPNPLVGGYEPYPAGAPCNGDLLTITFTATGGQAPYTFWYGDEEIPDGIMDFYAGNYEIMVIDANGCESLFELPITQPEPLEAEAIPEDYTICYNGTTLVTIYVTGGTEPYTYNGEEFYGTITFPAPVGEHVFTVIDAHGCEIATELPIEPFETIDIAITAAKECDDPCITVKVDCTPADHPLSIVIKGFNAITNAEILTELYTGSCHYEDCFDAGDFNAEADFIYFIAYATDEHDCLYWSNNSTTINFTNHVEFYVYETSMVGKPDICAPNPALSEPNHCDLDNYMERMEKEPVTHYFRVDDYCHTKKDIHLAVEYKYYYQEDESSPKIAIATIGDYLNLSAGGQQMSYYTPMQDCGASVNYNYVYHEGNFPRQAGQNGWYFGNTQFSFFKLVFLDHREITVSIPGGFKVPGIYTVEYKLVTHYSTTPIPVPYGAVQAVYCPPNVIGGTNFYNTSPGYRSETLGERTMYIKITKIPDGPVVSDVTADILTPDNFDESGEIVTITEIESVIDATIYPNPATDKINIKFTNIEGPTQLRISNVSGQIVVDKNIEVTSTEVNVDLPHLAPGIYIVNIATKDAILIRKLVIESK